MDFINVAQYDASKYPLCPINTQYRLILISWFFDRAYLFALYFGLYFCQ